MSSMTPEEMAATAPRNSRIEVEGLITTANSTTGTRQCFDLGHRWDSRLTSGLDRWAFRES